jgi:hypothetical protein
MGRSKELLASFQMVDGFVAFWRELLQAVDQAWLLQQKLSARVTYARLRPGIQNTLRM